MGNKCGDCKDFIGAGDWNLCCKSDSGLHYKDSDACDFFVDKSFDEDQKRFAKLSVHWNNLNYTIKRAVMRDGVVYIKCVLDRCFEVRDNGEYKVDTIIPTLDSKDYCDISPFNVTVKNESPDY